MKPIVLDLHSLSFVSLNVKGMVDFKKRRKINSFIKDFDIVFLQETHGDASLEQNFLRSFVNRSTFFSFGTSNARGVAISIKTHLLENTSVQFVTDFEGRRAILKIQHDKSPSNLVLACLYAPNLKSGGPERLNFKDFFSSTKDAVSRLTDENSEVISGGDLNTIFLPSTDAESCPARFDHVFATDILETFTSIELLDAFQFKNPDQTSFTFIPQGQNSKGIKRRLDHVFISENLASKLASASHDLCHFTDHKAVTLNFQNAQLAKRFKLWRHDDGLLKDEAYKNEVLDAINEALQEKDFDNRSLWEYVKYNARKKCREIESRRFKAAREEEQKLRLELKQLENSGGDSRRHLVVKDKIEVIEAKRMETLMKKSSEKWFDKNEKCTKYFFNRIKQNQKNVNVIDLADENGDRKLKAEEINGKIFEHFSQLFRKRPVNMTPDWSNELSLLPKLSQNEADELGKTISLKELHFTTFHLLRAGRSPGNDGFTVRFYRAFWNVLKKPLFNAFEESLQYGELSTAQRQSIIRLIRKKDRNPEFLDNWRPISLLNVDTKILSRTMSYRMSKVLERLIGPEQTAFVKGRNIAEGNRLLDYMIESAEKEGKSGVLAAIDFAKAFDSIDHDYIFKVLECFGFPENFIKMVKVLYHNAESAVMNNGRTTHYFPLERSCRQGDPISPYLFILALEPLLQTIRRNPGIHGLKNEIHEAKISVYADDLTIMARDGSDIKKVFDKLDSFSRISSLEVNKEKTKILKIGSPLLDQELSNLCEPCIKVTGIWHSTLEHREEANDLNFLPALDKLTNKLRLWKSRNLSLLGRIQVLKSQGISQFRFLANVIPVPPSVTKRINKLIYNFLWKGPDRISRDVISCPLTEGGMNFQQPKSVFNASLISWIGKIQKSKHPWTKFLIEDGKKIGGLRNLQRNVINLKNLDLLSFNREIFCAWKMLEKLLPGDGTTSTESGIWLNPRFRDAKGKLLKPNRLALQGFVSVSDFVDEQGGLVSPRQALNGGVPANSIFEWHKAYKAISKAGNPLDNVSGQFNFRLQQRNTTYPNLIASWDSVQADKLRTKAVLQLLAGGPQKPAKIPAKFRQAVGMSLEKWSDALKSIKQCSPDSPTRSFHYRILNGLLYGNKDFYKFGYAHTPACNWCGHLQQDEKHIFTECPKVRLLKDELASQSPVLNLSCTEWIGGSSTTIVNTAVTLINLYLYHANHQAKPISRENLTNFIESRMRLETGSAEGTNYSHKVKHKWTSLLAVFRL